MIFSDIKKITINLKKYGKDDTIRKMWYKLISTRQVAAVYAKKIPKAEIKRQRQYFFENPIYFSILTPLYNTEPKMLRDMLESVINQTYANWELCLIDASDDKHTYVETLVQSYLQKDTRIRYKKIKENGGISRNTNEALKMATGDYFSLLDHDDILHQSALYETMLAIDEKKADLLYTDEAVFSKKITRILTYHCKSDYAPDTLRGHNYICHFLTFSKKIYEQVGGFREIYDGSQDYDLVLRLTEIAKKIYHIPKILYFWRSHKASTSFNIMTKKYAITAGKKAVTAYLDRLGLRGTVTDTAVPGIYRTQYEIIGNPLITILIPTKDLVSDLIKCINSIINYSTYRNFQILVLENNSIDSQTFTYYDEIKKMNEEFIRLKRPERIEVIPYEGCFNYSRINNYGAQFALGKYLLFLNNDIEVISPDWLQEMLMFCQRSDVGVVGAMLYYPNNSVQHAGVILSLRDSETGHSHRYFPQGSPGYFGRLCCVQNMSAVTGACMMTKRSLFEQVVGFDENLAVSYNDIDFCMKVRDAGYLIVWTPFAELYHCESKSRGYDFESAKKIDLHLSETAYFKRKWQNRLALGDPYYNPNFTQSKGDFSFASKSVIKNSIFAYKKKILIHLKTKVSSNRFAFFMYHSLVCIRNLFRKI